MFVVTELFGFILEKKDWLVLLDHVVNSPQDKNPNIANLVVAVRSEISQASEVSNFEVHPCILYTDIYCHIY